jgi:dolichyl-phosphate beta-glucosyltransferase
MKNKSICIIPFFNEENRINKDKYQEFIFNNKDIDFLMIDDHSTDNTLVILNQFKEKCPNVIVRTNNYNKGKAKSIYLGMKLAVSDQYVNIGFLDADLATPLSEYKRLNDIIVSGGADVIFGSRVKLLGNEIKRNRVRHVISRVIVTLINFIFNLNIYDTQCGCKIFKGNKLDLILETDFYSNWLFDIEIFLRLFHLYGKKIKILEIPLNKWDDIKGSKIKIVDAIKLPYEIFKLIYFYKYKK